MLQVVEDYEQDLMEDLAVLGPPFYSSASKSNPRYNVDEHVVSGGAGAATGAGANNAAEQ